MIDSSSRTAEPSPHHDRTAAQIRRDYGLAKHMASTRTRLNSYVEDSVHDIGDIQSCSAKKNLPGKTQFQGGN
jgi:hypothetical protein